MHAPRFALWEIMHLLCCKRISSDRVIKLSLRAYVRIHNASDIESTIIVEILVMKLVHITFNFFYES